MAQEIETLGEESFRNGIKPYIKVEMVKGPLPDSALLVTMTSHLTRVDDSRLTKASDLFTVMSKFVSKVRYDVIGMSLNGDKTPRKWESGFVYEPSALDLVSEEPELVSARVDESYFRGFASEVAMDMEIGQGRFPNERSSPFKCLLIKNISSNLPPKS